MKILFIHACVTLEYFNFKREIEFKGLLSISIASAMTTAEQLLEEMNSIHIWIITIIHLRARLTSECIPTSRAR